MGTSGACVQRNNSPPLIYQHVSSSLWTDNVHDFHPKTQKCAHEVPNGTLIPPPPPPAALCKQPCCAVLGPNTDIDQMAPADPDETDDVNVDDIDGIDPNDKDLAKRIEMKLLRRKKRAEHDFEKVWDVVHRRLGERFRVLFEVAWTQGMGTGGCVKAL